MSDVTALSHEYETSAKVAEEINSLVLELKKSVSSPERALPEASRTRLAAIVLAIRNQLAHGLPGAGSAERLPEELLERIAARHKNQLQYFLSDLESTEQQLNESGTVEAPVLQTLDEICDAADAAASAMFRRLRRR